MSLSRVIEVSFNGGSIAYVKADTAYFYNNGIIFKPTDIDLPASYQVHWADSPQATSTLETIGTAEGAPIPDDLWNRSRVIYGWIYLHPTNDSGVTGYEVRIYKNVRAGMPDGTEPTPAEQSTIDQLISALNSAVEQTGQDVESASQSAQSAESAKTAAESARDTAGEYANDAESSAASASTSASQASTSATASAQSASQSAQIKADVEGMVDDAQSYAESALIASQASVTAKNTAQTSAQSASASAQSASTSASNASASANTASSKASEASTSAQTASQKATESAQSASQALSYKTDAESAKTASQTAQGLAESARDTAVSAKTDAESARDDAVQAKTDVQNIADGIDTRLVDVESALIDKAPVITDTASGAIASFTDGADDLPLKSLVVDINPIQDLHGQDAPYPAGGGKNLFENTASTTTMNGVTFTVNDDGTVSVSGTATADIRFDLGYWTATGETVIFNGCPNGGDTTTYRQFADYIGPNTGKDISATPTAGQKCNVRIQIYNGYTANNLLFKPMIRLASETDGTFAPYSNICPISGWTEVNVNHSDADMTNPTTITIDLGQTVYGGKLDVLSGVLTIYRGYKLFNGSEEWVLQSTNSYGICNYRYDNIASEYIGGDNVGAICNRFAPQKSGIAVTQTIGFFLNVGGLLFIRIPSTVASTVDEFKTWLADHNVQLTYALKNPIEIQLTPNQVNSLLGVNNIWADSGDSEVVYRADTKLFIERLTAPDSADMVADANITSGKYFMVGNSLYKATANIANGSAIIVGTNCIRKSLSEALNEINA